MKNTKQIERELLKQGIKSKPDFIDLYDIFAILAIVFICSLSWVGV